jgi:hypothetical protein
MEGVAAMTTEEVERVATAELAAAAAVASGGGDASNSGTGGFDRNAGNCRCGGKVSSMAAAVADSFISGGVVCVSQ